jgi:hypothetical protein
MVEAERPEDHGAARLMRCQQGLYGSEEALGVVARAGVPVEVAVAFVVLGRDLLGALADGGQLHGQEVLVSH